VESAVTVIFVCLGRSREGHDVVLDAGSAWHWAVQGATRSGKSVLCYVLLAQLAQHPEVVISGCDPTGILLHPFALAPHPEWRSLGSKDVPASLDVLDRLVDEMDRRIDQLRASDLDKLEDFTEAIPLVYVVLEEYPGTLSAAEADDEAEGRAPKARIASKIRRDVRRLVQEGAKAGFRVLILAQRMDASIIGGAERSNVGARITLRVDNRDAITMLHPNLPPETADVVPRFPVGRGVLELPGDGEAIFQTDRISYQAYLAHVRSHLGARQRRA